MEIKRNVLLNPGPATTTDTVKLAQVVPDICPREEEFGEVMEFVSKELTKFVGSLEEYTTILFGGSGTASVEAMISSVVGDGTLIIINNGAYGKRMCEIAEAYDISFIEFKSSNVEAIDILMLEKVIKEKKGEVSHLAVVHHETTTGLLNDVKTLGELCKKYNVEMLVDAMSSYAGIPIDMKDMNISYMASSSNKCIQGMAGISFVIANINSLILTKNNKPRNVYLNLYKQYEYFIKNYQMRFTPPVQVLYALKQAIIEAKEETIEVRNKRYVKSCDVLLEGLDRLNLTHLVKPQDHSKLITTILEPTNPKYKFDDMHDFLYERGFTIYPGKVSEANTFRVANIGEIDYKDMERFIIELENYVSTSGVRP
ncbi:2-aminoethylphosphonate aminotransferase [Clostridium algidicarnis]|uniref:2-aminoethylphosphonate aminotransferase n=1 Tax=Clostridium algidicarnis TaxID=37659 RepID=UPI001C0C00A6|nr:2-aminoethylphosphonate--pyruvate transaminase [Clostridium algidicarnis]MBU3226560.1 2-aminoethylphosphonate--pyruvate transaminase [Clostridium algidicarnis]MBU3250529.1 2-aminoethylphosphonate--pyruvate transaminase [Clostridium algidicarnis]